MLTLGGQVEADMPIIMHGAVELAVTDLAEVEGAPVVQLLAVGVVAYLCGKGWGGGWTQSPVVHGAPGCSSCPTIHVPEGPVLINLFIKCFPSTYKVSILGVAETAKPCPQETAPSK